MQHLPVPPEWTAIVLAGGRGRRLGGIDKAAVTIGGVPALDLLLADLTSATAVIVAGSERPTSRRVDFRLERPAGGGPVTGIAAALAGVVTPIVALLATDMPWAGRLATRLVSEFDPDRAGLLVPVDAAGRRQPLCAAASSDALRRALDGLGDPTGRSVRELLAHLVVAERPVSAEEAGWLDDIDTPGDLSRARQRLPSPTLSGQPTDSQQGAPAMDEWIDAVRIELDLDSTVDVDVLLDVARVAAHNVARPAAPVTTYLLGLAVAGGADLASAAKRIEALAAGWTQPE